MRNIYSVLVFLFVMGCTQSTKAQCTSCSLTGSSLTKIGTTNRYSTGSVTGASYFWSVTNGLAIVGSKTGSAVQVRRVSGSNARVCVVRYKDNSVPCSSCKTVQLQTCDLTRVDVVKTSGNCGDVVYEFEARTNLGSIAGLRYEWSASNGVILGPGNTSKIRVRGKNFSTNPGTIRVTVTGCVNTRVSGQGGTACIPDEPNCGPFPCFTVFPNPSTDGFTVDFDKGNTLNLKRTGALLPEEKLLNEKVTIELLDHKGQFIRSFITNMASFFITTNSLPPGKYLIKVTNSHGTISKSIIVR